MPQQGDFLRLFDLSEEDCGKTLKISTIKSIMNFTGSKSYIRQEILCVLENFKKVYQEQLNKDGEKQFVHMGSPGVGKSWLMALVCFYIAVVFKRPVLLHHYVVAGKKHSMTRLFNSGMFYEWEDDGGDVYQFLHKEVEVLQGWFCLDGMTQDLDNAKSYLAGAVGAFSWSENAESLLLNNGLVAEKEIHPIRMVGVNDR
ncbi:hypothetical protein AC1031_008046 [Aphanomyces cochlioides]|nr:hypothetical protein AC1031_008046 [Aphanomyces cochlioides]